MRNPDPKADKYQEPGRTIRKGGVLIDVEMRAGIAHTNKFNASVLVTRDDIMSPAFGEMIRMQFLRWANDIAASQTDLVEQEGEKWDLPADHVPLSERE